MTRRVSQSELAVLADVSPATVSRALAGHPGISEQVTQRIRTIAKKMDYLPSAAARSFVTRRHNTVGLVICDRSLASNVYARLTAAVENATRTFGLKLQLSFCDSSQWERGQRPPIFQDDGIDGVILTGALPDWLLKRITKWSMPFVVMGTYPKIRGVNHVSGDAYQGGRLMAEHLLKLGHHHIGLLVGPRSGSLHEQYFNGFRDGCLDAGFSPQQIENMVEECTDNDVVPFIQRLLRRHPNLTAIFANTDLIAWQAVQYLRAIGKQVPTDVSVAGAGGGVIDPLGKVAQLTSVNVRFSQMGRAAVQLLQELTKHPDTSSRRIVIEPILAVGNTAAALPATSEHIQVPVPQSSVDNFQEPAKEVKA